MKKSTQSLFYILFILIAVGSAHANLNITVKYDKGWGDAPTSNIKALCENVALHFQEQLRDEHKLNGKLAIVYNSDGPIAFYRTYFGGEPDEYQIGLAVTGLYWSQFAYQFGHEFCHILQNHDEITKNNPNDWFQEAMCELATLWVVKRMGETWKDRAPYPNWVSYRHSLVGYANNLINRPEAQYAGTGAEWLAVWESPLRDDEPGAFSYARVAQLSYKFLPIFEENPEAWNAVRQMPASKGMLSEYMKDWYETVDTEDKDFVAAIATEMGIEVATPVVAMNSESTIDADVNDDGYVDLYDVMIVRSGMNAETSYDTDVNNDGKTDAVDLLVVKAIAIEAIAKAAPSKRKVKITTWGAMKKR